MFAMLQFIGVLILMGAMIAFFRKFVKRPPVIVLGLCVTLVIVAVFSAGLLATIPMATEQITISAISDSNPDSTRSEIILSSVVVDGKIYHLSDPNEGNWICEENGYRWSNLSDASASEGITRSVTFDVPIGGGRNLIFVGGPDCGKVEISYNGSTSVYDLNRSEVNEIQVPFEATNGVYDNFVKILRLALFYNFVIVIMFAPILLVYKHAFEKYNHFFTKKVRGALELVRSYKIECILCAIGTLSAYLMFMYMDMYSLTAWSLENVDAFLRGGFNGFENIKLQDLWHAHHGVGAIAFSFSEFFWGIWNLPVLLLHYFFRTDCELTLAVMLWSKLFLELLALGTAYISYKIVYAVTKSKQRAMLCFVLVIGSATVMCSVGYAGQDEIFYLFFLMLSLYDTIIGRKNRALLWMFITLYQCPLMIIFTAIIVISSTEKILETIIRLGVNLIAILTSMLLYVGSGSVANSQISLIFERTLLPDANGSFSLFALIFVLVFLIQFSIRHRTTGDRMRFLLYSLCVISVAFLMFAYTHFYRHMICMLLIIICLTSVEQEKIIKSGFLGFCIFEYARAVIALSSHNNSINFKWTNPCYKTLFDIEIMPNISLYNYLKMLIPNLSSYLTIIHAIALAAGLWILYICYPKRKDDSDSEVVCSIPLKVITTIIVSAPVIITGLMNAISYKMEYVNVGYSNNVTEAITGSNYVEEYYKGKSADWVQIVFRPVTNGMSYPQSQMLNLDIVDVETGEVVGSGSCSAGDFKDKTNYTLKIDNVDMKSDKWYIFRYYSPELIEDEENYMYLLYSNAGTSDPDCHYALVKNDTDYGGEYIPANYDIGGEILTS